MTGPVVPQQAQIIVIAKEPVPGRVKTRLTPPFTFEEGALLAEAALADTLAAVAEVPAARRVLALAGSPGRWLPPGFDVIPQRGGALDERLANAFADAWEGLAAPMVLIGMDTPQVTPSLLESAMTPLVAAPTAATSAEAEAADATFGPAADGGFWLLGLREPDSALLTGVPMSTADTGRHQLERLTAAGLRVRSLPVLTDVDSYREAALVAAEIPGSRFAAAFERATSASGLTANC